MRVDRKFKAVVSNDGVYAITVQWKFLRVSNQPYALPGTLSAINTVINRTSMA